MSQLNTKGGLKSQKQYKTRAKTKAAQEKAKYKRSCSVGGYNEVSVYEPSDEEIYRREKLDIQQAQFHENRKGMNAMIYNLENQTRQQNRLFELLYRGRDPAFTDTYNPNAVINEPANDTASRALPWHMLQAQNQFYTGSSSRGIPQLRNETDLQSGTSQQGPIVQETDQDTGNQDGENISQYEREQYQQAKLWSDQLIQDNKETNRLEYEAGAPD
ncbi:MAG: hypothetical protein EZS28_026657, partial [Streblomastix strix]